MSTYVISLSNGQELNLSGESLEVLPDGDVVQLKSGDKTYNFFRNSILYWTTTPENLTDRQIEILRLITAGKTNGSISRNLGFSESTVRHETMAIYRSLGVSNREGAIQAAVANEMFELQDAI